MIWFIFPKRKTDKIKVAFSSAKTVTVRDVGVCFRERSKARVPFHPVTDNYPNIYGRPLCFCQQRTLACRRSRVCKSLSWLVICYTDQIKFSIPNISIFYKSNQIGSVGFIILRNPPRFSCRTQNKERKSVNLVSSRFLLDTERRQLQSFKCRRHV